MTTTAKHATYAPQPPPPSMFNFRVLAVRFPPTRLSSSSPCSLCRCCVAHIIPPSSFPFKVLLPADAGTPHASRPSIPTDRPGSSLCAVGR